MYSTTMNNKNMSKFLDQMKKLLIISDNVSVYLNLYQVNYFLLGQIWTESVEYMSFDVPNGKI